GCNYIACGRRHLHRFLPASVMVFEPPLVAPELLFEALRRIVETHECILGKTARLKYESGRKMERAIDGELGLLLLDRDVRRDGPVEVFLGDLLEARLDMSPQRGADVEILACDLDQHRS